MLDRLRRAGGAALRSLARRASAPFHVVKSMAIAAPARLRVAAPDMRTADPTAAGDILSGYFTFDGKTAVASGRSPFALTPPSPGWRRALAGFVWLGHLRAADGEFARADARVLVAGFLALRAVEPGDPAFETAVVARRLLSFLAHSPILLDGAESEFYERFMAALAREARILFRALRTGSARGGDRLLCAIALTQFCVCADAPADIYGQTLRILRRELQRQIFSDGGHVGRNPQTLLDLLMDLLPLRQVFAARGLHPPEAMLRAIDQMIPMLRMLRHGDGSLALFNGMGATALDSLATILSHEDALAAAPVNAPYAGYQRLEAGSALVIVDAGAPPPPEFSRHAHAGCLAFEYSLGAERVVVNCGAPTQGRADVVQLARATAAHSTLIVDDRSTCRFAPADEGGADVLVAGPSAVRIDRRQSPSGSVLELSHDGYAGDFGLIHERVLALTLDGARLVGEDRLVAAKGAASFAGAGRFALRFHIHPRARLAPTAGGLKIDITLPGGESLVFAAAGFRPVIEDSIFFAAPEGPRKSLQIVLSGPATPGVKVRWTFRRVAEDDGMGQVPPVLNV